MTEPSDPAGGTDGPIIVGPAGERLLVSARLGWLYLEQQHLDDAEAIFHAVLAWRPENEAARRGLETVAARRREPATEAGPATAGSSRSGAERRLARLRAYLATIRGAARRPASGVDEAPDRSAARVVTR